MVEESIVPGVWGARVVELIQVRPSGGGGGAADPGSRRVVEDDAEGVALP